MKLKRPYVEDPLSSATSPVTTPLAAEQSLLLGGILEDGLTVTAPELEALKRLYGFVPELPRPRPPKPVEPTEADFPGEPHRYRVAHQQWTRAVQLWGRWEDPRAFMQAGADRDALRYAKHDGMRLIAWLARFCEPGQDPLKLVVSMAVQCGYDVDGADVDWAQTEEDDEEEPHAT